MGLWIGACTCRYAELMCKHKTRSEYLAAPGGGVARCGRVDTIADQHYDVYLGAPSLDYNWIEETVNTGLGSLMTPSSGL